MLSAAFDTVKKYIHVYICAYIWQKAGFGPKYVKVIYQKDGVTSFGNTRLSQHMRGKAEQLVARLSRVLPRL